MFDAIEPGGTSVVCIQPKPLVSTKMIQRVVAEYYNYSVADMIGPSRSPRVSWVRQIAMTILYHYRKKEGDIYSWGYKRTAQAFHRRDHTTARHGIKKIERIALTNVELQLELAEIRQKLGL